MFGFRTCRAALDSFEVFVTDIVDAFGKCESLLEFSLDIKGAFNCVKPKILLEITLELGVFNQILNFVAHSIFLKQVNFLSGCSDSVSFYCGIKAENELFC